MALPTVYTEDELKVYLQGILGDIADMLGWSVAADSYDEVVNDALGAYDDGNDISLITGVAAVKKLRVLARLALWTALSGATVTEINYSADGASWSREAIHKHAMAMMAQARVDALPYHDDYDVGNVGVLHTGDPYAHIEI